MTQDYIDLIKNTFPETLAEIYYNSSREFKGIPKDKQFYYIAQCIREDKGFEYFQDLWLEYIDSEVFLKNFANFIEEDNEENKKELRNCFLSKFLEKNNDLLSGLYEAVRQMQEDGDFAPDFDEEEECTVYFHKELV